MCKGFHPPCLYLADYKVCFEQDSHKDCSAKLLEESGGCWCDLLLPIVKEAWKNGKKGTFQFWSEVLFFIYATNGDPS